MAGTGFQFVEKALLFHKLCADFKWKRGLAPFSKPFPLATRLLFESGGSFSTVSKPAPAGWPERAFCKPMPSVTRVFVLFVEKMPCCVLTAAVLTPLSTHPAKRQRRLRRCGFLQRFLPHRQRFYHRRTGRCKAHGGRFLLRGRREFR